MESDTNLMKILQKLKDDEVILAEFIGEEVDIDLHEKYLTDTREAISRIEHYMKIRRQFDEDQSLI